MVFSEYCLLVKKQTNKKNEAQSPFEMFTETPVFFRMPPCPSERSYKGQRLEISPYETGRPFRTSGGLRMFQGQGQGKNMAPTVSGGAPAHTKSNIRVFSFVFLYFPKGNLRWHFNDIMSNMGAHCQNTVSQ